ncbi:MAG TPA: serine/threonine-protein kinase, partial [Solirubrobacteraceae bacterium]|nr:serine/threonine-protein kinase [Solirubrobacteraceae bacterium]
MSGDQDHCGGLAVGEAVGPYLLEGVLGEGGMGCVFLARRQDADELVALKVLKAGLPAEQEYARRFAHEARATAAVRHPHLVELLEVGEHNRRPYLAMRYVAGASLEDRLAGGEAMTATETVTLCAQVASALDALHEAGLVHRDVKAANVLIDATGDATLTDFGLARAEGYTALTRPGQVMGTIDYMAPELLMGER